MIKLFYKLIFALCFWLLTFQGHAQSKLLTIDECYGLARKNYPMIRQRELIDKTKDFSVENAAKGYLPQVNMLGQATYQSAVTEFKLPVAVPGVEFPSISKDQYKVYGEVTQTIYDGGAIDAQVRLHKANALLEEQKLDVELYRLNERVNQVFFGILMLDEQIRQNEILKKDIQLGITKVKALVDNGTAFKSNGYILQAEQLKADQRTVELNANRQAYLDMLGMLVNQSMDDVQLVKPQSFTLSGQINRPELRMYDYQSQNLDIQEQLLRVKNRPKFNFFFQGGFGRPALNILNNGFDPYYITGLRLNWSLAGLYTRKNDRLQIGNNRQAIQIQKETFLYNTNLTLKQQNADLGKLEKLLGSDDEIIALRENIKITSAAQLENGVINTNDYLREVHAEDQARLNRILHEIQLLMSRYNLQTTLGRESE